MPKKDLNRHTENLAGYALTPQYVQIWDNLTSQNLFADTVIADDGTTMADLFVAGQSDRHLLFKATDTAELTEAVPLIISAIEQASDPNSPFFAKHAADKHEGALSMMQLVIQDLKQGGKVEWIQGANMQSTIARDPNMNGATIEITVPTTVNKFYGAPRKQNKTVPIYREVAHRAIDYLKDKPKSVEYEVVKWLVLESKSTLFAILTSITAGIPADVIYSVLSDENFHARCSQKGIKKKLGRNEGGIIGKLYEIMNPNNVKGKALTSNQAKSMQAFLFGKDGKNPLPIVSYGDIALTEVKSFPGFIMKPLVVMSSGGEEVFQYLSQPQYNTMHPNAKDALIKSANTYATTRVMSAYATFTREFDPVEIYQNFTIKDSLSNYIDWARNLVLET